MNAGGMRQTTDSKLGCSVRGNNVSTWVQEVNELCHRRAIQ